MMRIITGSARGAKLQAPAGEATRPTAERTKEAVFSMLGNGVFERRVLDLFAGSGQNPSAINVIQSIHYHIASLDQLQGIFFREEFLHHIFLLRPHQGAGGIQQQAAGFYIAGCISNNLLLQGR